MIVNKNASLKKLNTFNVDASCDVLVESSNTNDILEVLNNKELNINPVSYTHLTLPTT